jgi:hypothetical protein
MLCCVVSGPVINSTAINSIVQLVSIIIIIWNKSSYISRFIIIYFIPQLILHSGLFLLVGNNILCDTSTQFSRLLTPTFSLLHLIISRIVSHPTAISLQRNISSLTTFDIIIHVRECYNHGAISNFLTWTVLRKLCMLTCSQNSGDIYYVIFWYTYS